MNEEIISDTKKDCRVRKETNKSADMQVQNHQKQVRVQSLTGTYGNVFCF